MPAHTLDDLATEQCNPASAAIDEMTTIEMMALMNQEDQKVPLSIALILPQIADAVDLIAAHLQRGGRLIYCGAGTSGRLGVLDAAECPPTFGTDPGQVMGLIAGGREAMFRAQEGAEDDEAAAVSDLTAIALRAADVVVGLSASGRTPYAVSALRYARRRGAATVAVASSPASPLAKAADVALTALPGAEVIAGSTRLKAGTVQKLILNMLSTGTMIRLGKVYGNRMVDVQATNEKLARRALRMVQEVTGDEESTCQENLNKANGNAKLAILVALSDLSPEEGTRCLQKAEGHLKTALKSLSHKGGMA
ncbi:MAG: N-acetylmuramic acid 6-phosphate etherase [Schwartzia sp. (in: firmicutes)]